MRKSLTRGFGCTDTPIALDLFQVSAFDIAEAVTICLPQYVSFGADSARNAGLASSIWAIGLSLSNFTSNLELDKTWGQRH
jgi:hypothetical protein